MRRPRSMAMVSSAAQIHAERLLIADDLDKVFEKVVRSPELSVAGTNANDYLADAEAADFLVVLLGCESRPAVLEEIETALQTGAYIAAFSLRYPPFYDRNTGWTPTDEENVLREHGIFVKQVDDINQLRRETMLSLGQFLSDSTRRLQFKTLEATYQVAQDWLKIPKNVQRVALVQRTSSVFLGARTQSTAEIGFYNKLTEYIDLATRSGRTKEKGRRFVHLLDEDLTLAELDKNSSDYMGQPIKKAVALAKHKRNSKGSSRVHIRACMPGSGGPLLIVDDKIGYSISLGTGGSYISVIEDSHNAGKLFDALWQADRQISTEFLDLFEGASN